MSTVLTINSNTTIDQLWFLHYQHDQRWSYFLHQDSQQGDFIISWIEGIVYCMHKERDTFSVIRIPQVVLTKFRTHRVRDLFRPWLQNREIPIGVKVFGFDTRREAEEKIGWPN